MALDGELLDIAQEIADLIHDAGANVNHEYVWSTLERQTNILLGYYDDEDEES